MFICNLLDTLYNKISTKDLKHNQFNSNKIRKIYIKDNFQHWENKKEIDTNVFLAKIENGISIRSHLEGYII